MEEPDALKWPLRLCGARARGPIVGLPSGWTWDSRSPRRRWAAPARLPWRPLSPNAGGLGGLGMWGRTAEAW